MEIREQVEDDKVILEVKGSIDTNTSREVQEKILTALKKSRIVYLDLKETHYVSSAGLRSFLIGQKTAKAGGGSFRLVHIQDVIRTVLEMTGFDEVLEIWEDIQ